jgi:hypothetical protein
VMERREAHCHYVPRVPSDRKTALAYPPQYLLSIDAFVGRCMLVHSESGLATAMYLWSCDGHLNRVSLHVHAT